MFTHKILVTLLTFVISNVVGQQANKRFIVNYLGEDYIVKGGCPQTDPMILEWRDFCSHLHSNVTLCKTERFGRELLTVPRFSNVCDALCHPSFSSSMSECPKERGEKPKPFSVDLFGRDDRQISESKNVIIKYKNSDYIAKTGCPVRNPIVKRFYNMCLATFKDRTVCVYNRFPGGHVISFPKYTDVCSAMCHKPRGQGLDQGMRFCEHPAKVVGVSPV